MDAYPEVFVKKKCKVVHPLVAVYWLDAYCESGWVDEQTPIGTLVVTYGLLTRQDKKWITLSATHVPDSKGKGGYWGNQWNIPYNMVKKIEIIRKAPVCEA